VILLVKMLVFICSFQVICAMRTIKITNTQSCSYCYGWGERFFTQDDCVWAVINGRSCIVESKLRKQSLLFVILYRSGWRRLCQLAWELDL